jgi:hypothetical protein
MDKQLTAMEQAARKSNTLKDALSQLTGGLSDAGSGSVGSHGHALAGVALAKKGFDFVTDGIRNPVQSHRRTKRHGVKLGISYADLANFDIAATLSGTSLEEIGKAAAKLQMNLGNGSDGTVGALRKLGLGLEDLKNVPVSKAMELIANGFSGLTSQSDKAAVSTALFGKSGQNLIQLLEGGGEAFRRSAEMASQYGLALDSIDAAAIAQANDMWDLAGKALDGVFQKLTVELAPAIGTAGSLLEWAASNSETFGEGMVKSLEAIIDPLGIMNAGLQTTFALMSAISPGMAKGFEDALKVS